MGGMGGGGLERECEGDFEKMAKTHLKIVISVRKASSPIPLSTILINELQVIRGARVTSRAEEQHVLQQVHQSWAK